MSGSPVRIERDGSLKMSSGFAAAIRGGQQKSDLIFNLGGLGI